MKYLDNPSNVNRVFVMQTDGQTDMTKLILAFRNFLKVPKNFSLEL